MKFSCSLGNSFLKCFVSSTETILLLKLSARIMLYSLDKLAEVQTFFSQN